MDEPLLKIGELAAFFSVSVKAIRLYEKKGIIHPARIDPATGYRYYTVDQVQTLNAVVELKSLGFSLKEIQGILHGGYERGDFAAALQQKRIAWQNAVSAAENKIDAIDNIAKRIASSSEAGKLGRLSDEQRALLLVKMVCVEDMRGQSSLSEALWL